MQDIIINLMNQYGYLGIFLLITVENVFPPIPSEIILGFAGYMTKTTNLTLLGVSLVSTFGSCLGALILYYFGILINKEKLIKLLSTPFGRLLHLNADDINKANDWFLKKGNKTVLIGRFIPVIRSIISIPAGISKMPLCTFLTLTATGTFIWNSILTIFGSILGNNWYKLCLFMKKYSLIVIFVLLILFIVFISLLRFKKKSSF